MGSILVIFTHPALAGAKDPSLHVPPVGPTSGLRAAVLGPSTWSEEIVGKLGVDESMVAGWEEWEMVGGEGSDCVGEVTLPRGGELLAG